MDTISKKQVLEDAFAITAEQLTTMSPPDIDTLAAALYEFQADQNARASRALEALHYSLKERKQSRGQGHSGWPTSHPEAERKARALFEAGTLPSWDQRSLGADLTELDAARTAWERAKTPNVVIDGEWDRRGGWSRFFVVRASGGHIHSSLHCQTCRPTTDLGWLPQMSGRTEADAVAEEGPLLCTVCYPSAPLEWTVGTPKPEACGGTDEPAVPGTERRNYSGTYGKCPECGDSRKLKASGRLPRHQPKK